MLGVKRMGERRRFADINSGADANTDPALDFERDQRFAYRRPRHLQLFGKIALDSANGVIGPMTAELLGLPVVTACSKLEIAGGKGAININVLWEMGGAQRVLHGAALDGALRPDVLVQRARVGACFRGASCALRPRRRTRGGRRGT